MHTQTSNNTQIPNNKRDAVYQISNEPNSKRQCLEKESYYAKFEEIWANLALSGNEAKLKIISQQLQEIKPFLEGKAHQKCIKKITFVSQIILHPTFDIISSNGVLTMNSSLLAHESNLIKKMILNNQTRLDLSETYHPDIVDMAFMYIKHQKESLLEKENLLEIAMLSDYLQSKQLLRICAKKLRAYICNFPFSNINQFKKLINFYNYTKDNPFFHELSFYIQKKLSKFLLIILTQDDHLLFQKIKRVLKEKISDSIILDFSNTLLTETQFAFFKNFPIKGFKLNNCQQLTPNFWNILQTFTHHKKFTLLYLPDAVITETFSLKQFPNLEELRILNCSNMNDAAIQQLPLSLKKLWVNNNSNIGLLSCQHISKMTYLEELNISNCPGIDDAAIQQLPLNLKKLWINNNSNIGLLSCQHISKMIYLEELGISNCPNINNAAIQQLPLSLKKLWVSHNPNIDSLSCQHISTITYLEELDISNCSNINDPAIQQLPLSLKKLWVSNNPNIGLPSCQHISKMMYLKALSILNCPNINDTAIQQLPLSLKKLWVKNNPNIGLLSCQHVSSMTYLKELDIANCMKINDAAIQQLPINLKKLWVSHNPHISLTSCHHISNMTYLEELDIANCKKINDAAIQQLPLNLKKLGMANNPHIGILSCQHISHMIHLKKLWISNCKKINDVAIQQLPLYLRKLWISKNAQLDLPSLDYIFKMTNLKEVRITSSFLNVSNTTIQNYLHLFKLKNVKALD